MFLAELRPRVAAPRRTLVLVGSLPFNRLSSEREDGLYDGVPYRVRFLPEAFADVIGSPVPVLVNHVTYPIGKATLSETASELRLLFPIDLGNPHHQRVVSDYRAGTLTGFSPTFKVREWKDDVVGEGDAATLVETVLKVRTLSEISICRRPEFACCESYLNLIER